MSNNIKAVNVGNNEQITVKIMGLDNKIAQFVITKDTPLKKLMNAYCDRAGIPMSTVRFCFDGQRIEEQDTPISLEMLDGDLIGVYQYQTGGFYA